MLPLLNKQERDDLVAKLQAATKMGGPDAYVEQLASIVETVLRASERHTNERTAAITARIDQLEAQLRGE